MFVVAQGTLIVHAAPCGSIDMGIRAITQIFNSVLRAGHFPGQWKVSQIITILKPGKPAAEVTSYRPISLLPILSRLLEKILPNKN